MIAGRSKKVLKGWLQERPTVWKDKIEVVAMDGFTGFKTAAAEQLPGTGVPTALVEVRKLATTLTRRAADVLTYFDHPRTSNSPTEAICESGFGWSGTGWSGWMSVVPARV